MLQGEHDPLLHKCIDFFFLQGLMQEILDISELAESTFSYFIAADQLFSSRLGNKYFVTGLILASFQS